MNSASALALVIYVAALAWIVWRGRNAARSDDMFNVFGRRARTLRAASGYLSLIGAGELITITQLGHDNGLYLLLFPGGIACGFLFLAAFGARVRDHASSLGATTMASYVTAAYGRSAGVALTLAYTISLGALLIVQFSTGAELLSVASGIPQTIAILLLAAVILIYLEIGGLVAVLSTDLLRLLFMTAILVAITIGITANLPADHRLLDAGFTALPAVDASILFVLGFFGAVCAGDVWQTIIASESKAVVRRSMIFAAIAFMVLGLMIGFLGMAAKAVATDSATGGTALTLAIQTVVPAILVPLASILIAGAIMATADTEIWVVSTTIVTAIDRAEAEERSADRQHRIRRYTQLTLPVVTAAAVAISLLAPSAQLVYNALLGLLTALAPAMLGVILGMRARLAISTSLWAGLLAFAAINIHWSLQPPALALLIAVGIGAMALILSGLAQAAGTKT